MRVSAFIFEGVGSMKPLIGILPLYDVQKESLWMLPGYMDAVAQAGGLPVMLPPSATQEDIAQMGSLCDGFLFTGGQDVEPGLYGEEKQAFCGEIWPLRDILETALLKHALELDKPVLGICRGLQFINVHMGGALYQDIVTQDPAEKEIEHQQKPPYSKAAHSVTVLPGTPLHNLLHTGSIQVNSHHHQGIKRLANGLAAMAVTGGGLVEAIYAPGHHYVRAYQWHPEFMCPQDEKQRMLFDDFIDACKR